MHMKPPMTKNEIEMRKRFDFSRATRGRFADRYALGHTVTLLDGDPDMEDPLDLDSNPVSTRDAGKEIFVSQVTAAGLKLAEPLQDPSIDYLIYGSESGDREIVSCAVKVKTSVHETFSLFKTDLKVPGSLLAYVWNAGDPAKSSVYALTYREALKIFEKKPYVKSDAWLKDGRYTVVHAGAELKEMLEPYRMTRDRWQQRLQTV
jgi:hypothetical protein